MAITAQFLKNIMTEARPIIERQMNDAKVIAGFRSVVADAGGDWGALKALIKAHIEDENDEAGDGQRVHKILEKADCTSAYADMLGLANMNENNFSSDQSYAEVKGGETTTHKSSNSKALGVFISAFTTTPSTEITESENQSEQPCTATGPSASLENASDEISSINSPSDHVSEPAVAKPQAPQTATADQFPDPQPSTVADGQRGVPSLAADGAKSDGFAHPSSVGTALADRQDVKAEQAVTLSPSSDAFSLPLTTTGADAPPPVSAPTNSEKPHCLKLRDGECRLRFETAALCHECNAERMKARAQA